MRSWRLFPTPSMSGTSPSRSTRGSRRSMTSALAPAGESLWNQPTSAGYPRSPEPWRPSGPVPNRIQPDPTFRYENGHASADFAAFDRAARTLLRRTGSSLMPTCLISFTCSAGAFRPRTFSASIPLRAIRLSRRPTGPDQTRVQAGLPGLPAVVLGTRQGERLARSVRALHLRRAVLPARADPAADEGPARDDPRGRSRDSRSTRAPGSMCPNGMGRSTSGAWASSATCPWRRWPASGRRGARIWFTTDGQMCLDTPYCAIERLLPHYAFRYGAEAYEFWGIAWLTHDPFRFGWHAYIHQTDQPGQSYWIRYPNGDGFLLYPGTPIGEAGPVSSIRLEQARKGLKITSIFTC